MGREDYQSPFCPADKGFRGEGDGWLFYSLVGGGRKRVLMFLPFSYPALLPQEKVTLGGGGGKEGRKPGRTLLD